MQKKSVFEAGGKTAALYLAERPEAPLVVLNNFAGDGSGVAEAMREIRCGDCSLLSVGGLNWDHDMTPWYCPPLSADDTPCTGGAEEYLAVLQDEILPGALQRIPGEPAFLCLAGYSLAGLFALYALYRTDRFARAASMSGSLWFPQFREFALSHELKRAPEKLYLSLGDQEAKTRNQVLRTVQENTEFLAERYRSLGIPTEYELNAGNHYKDAALRSAKGISAIVSER